MTMYEVTLSLGTTRNIRADSEHEAIDIVKHTTEWSQCDIDSVIVEVIEEKSE